MNKNIKLGSVLLTAAALAGCPSPTDPPLDAGRDAPVSVDGGRDAPALTDVPVLADTGVDGGPVDPDDASVDAFVPPVDGGPPPLPTIANPAAHTVAASTGGHDRFFGVVFDDDSSFYVVGTTAAGTASTDDHQTLVGHFGANGELDTTWGDAGWFSYNIATGTNGEVARGIAVDSNGDIVVGATVENTSAGAEPRDRNIAFLRIDGASGELDESFGTSGIAIFELTPGLAAGTSWVTEAMWNLELDDTDRIVAAVQVVRDETDVGVNDNTDWGIVRVLSDGSDLDDTFSADGFYSFDIGNVGASVREAHILPSGDIAGAGYYSLSGSVRPVLYVVDEDGVPASSFGGGDGIYSEVVFDRQVEAYGAALHMGTHFVTAGYGGPAGSTNDFISLRIDAATGVRDLTYGAGGPRACSGGPTPGVVCAADAACGAGGTCPAAGIAMLSGFDFGDNARAALVLPDDRVMLIGRLATTRAPRTCLGGSMAGTACTADAMCGTRACSGGTNPGATCAGAADCMGGGTCPAATFNCAASQFNAALWVLTAAGVTDTTFGGGDGVELFDVAGEAFSDPDTFHVGAVDPRGQRVAVVGVSSSNPAADDDGLLYVFDP